MELPEVSIIIPTFNYGHLIEETLESISNQSFENWECIIVDNESTDNTEEVVKQWIQKDKRFKYLKIKHSTTSTCRNKGLEISRGKFLQFVDADDQISEGKLENQLELFKANTNASIVYSNAKYYDHGNSNKLRYTLDESNTPWMVEFTGYSWELLTQMLKKNLFVISSPLLKRVVYEETKGFLDRLNWVEDWEFYFRCFANNYYVVFDNSENSSSQSVRNNTEIRKWFRSVALSGRTRWEKFPDLNAVKSLSEEGFQQYVKQYLTNHRPRVS